MKRKNLGHRRQVPRLELLEERALPSASLWNGYGHDAQHTAISSVAAQPLDTIRWQTPVDLAPVYSGTDLLIHYGSPEVTQANTVIVPVRTGTNSNGVDQFEVTAHKGSDGTLMWTNTSPYILPDHNWTPSFAPTLTPAGRLYFAGAGGTIYYMNSPDSVGATISGQLAFYGIANYNADPNSYNSSVFIDSPLTSDSAGNIYFAFRVQGTAPLGLQSGIARIGADGSGTWTSATAASGGDTTISAVPHNCAPALSNDGKTLYIGVRDVNNDYYGYLVGLDSTTLAPKERVFLNDPRPQSGGGFNPAGLLDDSTASPTVGPDGDVYYGIFGNPYNGSRGWLSHFSSDLSVAKTFGAFGWDDTASIVPASMVPSYTGSSSYLVFTKYNNYAGVPDGGDGVNKIAILDPNATEVESHGSSNGLLVMKEILTIAGVTPDPNFINNGYPNAVREWCINNGAVDPATKSILANSEDGKVYRWDLTTNTFTQVVTLTAGIGEAYTPTIVGADGSVFAVNNAILFSVGLPPATHFSVAASATITAGNSFSLTVSAQDVTNAVDTHYLGTVHFTSSDGAASLPPDFTFTAADQGIHTFTNGATLFAAGNRSLTATDTISPTTGSANVNVTPASTARLAIGLPSATTAGSFFTITVAAQDAFANLTPGYTGTVAFSSSDGGATLPANYTFQSGDNGAHTFSNAVRLVTAGSRSLAVKDTVSTTISGSGTLVVSPAALAKFSIGLPTSTTASVPFTITVTALDAFSNITNGYQGTVQFHSSDNSASLPPNYLFLASDQGQHTFVNAAVLRAAGNQTLTVADTTNTALAGTGGILVNPGGAASFQITGPSAGTAGVAFSITVTALDSSNNIATTYLGSIHFSSSDTTATLPGDFTFSMADGGVHTFTNALILRRAGLQHLASADTLNASIAGSGAFLISAASASTLHITGPAMAQAGAQEVITVQVQDAFGNVVTNYARTVHFQSTDVLATLPGDYTFVMGDGGVHTFTNVVLRRPGNQEISVTDISMATVTGSATIQVRALTLVATGADAGGAPEVNVVDVSTGTVRFDFFAYDTRFLGGVRVAVGDVNGDGIPDIITAPGPGGGPDVRVFDGVTGQQIRGFMAYAPTFSGGVYVAAGDVNGDGLADVITGPGAGGIPIVKAFSGKNGAVLDTITAYDPRFLGGVRVAAGDVHDDGHADIITAAGPGGGPHVEVFNGLTQILSQSFFAYDSRFTGGVYLAAVDLNGDGHADIITGAGAGGGPQVKVFSGVDDAVLHSFFAYDPAFLGGVRVGVVGDINGDGRPEIVTGAGPGGGPHTEVFDGTSLAVLDSYFAFHPLFPGGIYVGGQ